VRDYRALTSLSPAQEQELAELDAAHRAKRLADGYALLNTGARMPLVGLGTWQAAPGEVGRAVTAALKAGYRHIDCASVYGNEREVGEALARAFAGGGDGDDDGNTPPLKRSDVFVCSKLWNDAKRGGAEGIERACRQSLRDLGLDLLDLYLIHWPVVSPSPAAAAAAPDPTYLDTWRAMERLVHPLGLVRAIGVSNLSERKLRALIAAGVSIPPAVNQVEAHPLWRNDALLRACAELGVHVTAFSPLGSSADATAALLGQPSAKPLPSLLRHPAVLAAAESASKRCGAPRSPAQIVLRWNLERGVSVLPKSVHPDRIAANLDVLSPQWALFEEERAALSSAVEPQARMVSGALWLAPVARGSPYTTLADLWDEPEGADERQAAAMRRLAEMGPDWRGGSGTGDK
jgi:diketogulonate reductase-like aldo/keto reductase